MSLKRDMRFLIHNFSIWCNFSSIFSVSHYTNTCVPVLSQLSPVCTHINDSTITCHDYIDSNTLVHLNCTLIDLKMVENACIHLHTFTENQRTCTYTDFQYIYIYIGSIHEHLQ